jgi:ERCC4-type nuclease
MSIILDIREQALIALLPEIPTRQLPVGDIWIQIDTEEQSTSVLVIERKTTADFEASFLDGRYREQRTRLLAHCAEQKAKALYILEGGLDGHHTRLERQALQKLAHRLMLRYGVSVWCTRNIEDTANTIQILAQQIKEDPKVFEGTQVSYTDVQHITKKANKDDPSAFAIAALQGCPGISSKASTAIWTAVGKSWDALLKTEEKQLADIKVGERRLGPAVAKRLFALLHTTTTIHSI